MVTSIVSEAAGNQLAICTVHDLLHERNIYAEREAILRKIEANGRELLGRRAESDPQEKPC